MAISIEVFSKRIYRLKEIEYNIYIKSDTFIKIGAKDNDKRYENCGVLNYYLVEGFKIELIGEDASYIRKMKDIKISVSSKSGNEVNVCGVKKISVERIGDRYFTNIIPVICTKLKKKYLNCGDIGGGEVEYQELIFELSYTINEDGIDKSYRVTSKDLKFVTGKIDKKNVEEILPIMNAMEIPSFYRPFYFNAVLLLFPKNFGINESTHAYEFNNKVKDAERTLNRETYVNENNEIIDLETPFEHSKYCHGRLFYSIANGVSLSEKMKVDNNTNDVNVNCLEKVTLDINQGEYNITIQKPFRLYDELECFYEANPSKDKKSNNAAENKVENVDSLTKKISFGITEPFVVDTKNKKIYRDGIPLCIYGSGENKVKPVLKRYNSSTLTFNGENVKSTGEYNDRGYLYGHKHYFPIDSISKSYFQSVGEWGAKQTFEIDTTKTMSFSFSVTDAAPDGHKDEATTISLNYNGVAFYDEIYQSTGGYYTVKGNSSQGVRYYLLMVNDGKFDVNTESSHLAPRGEFDNLMRSIYDYSICQTNGYSEPRVRYGGVHTNDYITEKNNKNWYISAFNGWQGMYTCLKVSGNTKEVCLYGNENVNHQCIDITGILKRCEGGQSIQHTCGTWRPVVIGVYDTYTSLSEDEYNDTKKYGNRTKYIKLHTNRFSIIKVYKVNSDKE